MRKTTRAIGITTATLFWLTPLALAEGPQQGAVMQPQQGPYAGPQVVTQPEGEAVMQPQGQEATASEGRGLEYGGHLLIPFFVSNPVAVVVDGSGLPIAEANAGIGVGLQGRIGWEFGQGLAAELNIGGTFNTLSGENPLTGLSVDVNTTLRSVWLGVGARYSFLNSSALVPFVGGGVALNFWDFCPDSASSCNLEPTFGANALAGVIYEVNPNLGIEAGLQLNVIFPNENVFVDTEFFLAPFIGATLYY